MNRYAFGIQTPQDPSMIFISSDFFIKKITEYSNSNYGHLLPVTVYLKCPHIFCTAQSLSNIVTAKNKSGKSIIEAECNLPNIRIIAIHNEISVDIDMPSEDGLLIMVERLQDCEHRGWYNSGNKTVHALVKIDRDFDDLSSLLEDITLDISLANSRPYEPIVKAIIEDIGREEFYKNKVDFVLTLDKASSAYGVVQKDCCYVSLSSIARNVYRTSKERLGLTKYSSKSYGVF